MPSFIQFDKQLKLFTISPDNLNQVNSYLIQVDLIDEFDAKTTYVFEIEVLNDSYPIYHSYCNELSLDLDNDSISMNNNANSETAPNITFFYSNFFIKIRN